MFFVVITVLLLGKVIEHTTAEEEEEEEFEEEEVDHSLEGEIPGSTSEAMETTETDTSFEKDLVEANTPDLFQANSELLTPSQTSAKSNDVAEQSVSSVLLKPDLNEVQKKSNRDTMMYLKSKRINRHKNNEGTEVKKLKTTE